LNRTILSEFVKGGRSSGVNSARLASKVAALPPRSASSRAAAARRTGRSSR